MYFVENKSKIHAGIRKSEIINKITTYAYFDDFKSVKISINYAWFRPGYVWSFYSF